MYELLTGSPPYATLTTEKAISLVCQHHLPRLESKLFSKETASFINQCLTGDPEKRPTALELLRSRYFRGVKTHVAKSPLLAICKKYNRMRAAPEADGEQQSPPSSVQHSQPAAHVNQWDFEESL